MADLCTNAGEFAMKYQYVDDVHQAIAWGCNDDCCIDEFDETYSKGDN